MLNSMSDAPSDCFPDADLSSTKKVASTSSSRNKFRPNLLLWLGSLIVIVFALFVVSLILFRETHESHNILFIGGIVGTISTSLVIISYIYIPKIRIPPITLLLFRSICDLGIAIRFIWSPSYPVDDMDLSLNCHIAAGLLEFFEIASEAWFFCAAYELALTLTNPFSSFKQRLKWYHIGCWSTAAIMGCIVGFQFTGLWYVNDDVSERAICYVDMNKRSQHGFNPRPWFFAHVPLIVTYAYAIHVTYVTYRILWRQGINKTFHHRARVLYMSILNIFLFLCYWITIQLCYVLAYELTSFQTPCRLFWLFLTFGVSGKGFASLLVLVSIMRSDIFSTSADDDVQIKIDEVLFDLNLALRQEVMLYATTGVQYCASTKCENEEMTYQSINMSLRSDYDVGSSLTFRDLLQLGMGSAHQIQRHLLSFIRRDLSLLRSKIRIRHSNSIDNPLDAATLNAMLQMDSPSSASMTSLDIEGRMSSNENFKHELRITHYLMESERRSDLTLPLSPRDSHTNSSNTSEKQRNSVCDTLFQGWLKFLHFLKHHAVVVNYDEEVEFVEYCPAEFRNVRLGCGVSDRDFIKSFESTIKERLTQGGASGAMFFYSKDNQYIAKSATKSEINHIRSNSKSITQYLISNKKSYITKIYGIYKLRMYATEIYFMVTNNIFGMTNGETINEIYDLKGSWVNRHGSTPFDGQLIYCRHCNQPYIFRKKYRVKFSSDSEILDNQSGGKITPLIFDEKGTNGGVRCPVYGHEPGAVMKDNDLKYKIHLPRERAREMLMQLISDSKFLCDMGVMDYSLLVGVHNTQYNIDPVKPWQTSKLPKSSEQFDYSDVDNDSVMSSDFKKRQSQSSVKTVTPFRHTIHTEANANPRLQAGQIVGPYSYYMGIVDYQQEYNIEKQWENWIKVKILRKHKDGISSIEPVLYRARFLMFIKELIVFTDDDTARDI